jgi:bromodomain-containing protein 7/9
MLNNLRQTQHDRLSAPPPQHLSNVPKPSESEVTLAEKITQNLTSIAKKLPPSSIAPVDGLRKAMGIAPLGGPEPMEVEPITHNPSIVTDNAIIQENSSNQESSNMLPIPMSLDMNNVRQGQLPMQMVLAQNQPTSLLNTTETSGVTDLESELREFLESDPTLGHSPLHDDKTLEDILSES